MEEKATAKNRLWFRLIRIFMRVFVAFIAFFVALTLALNIPAVQTYVAGIAGQSFGKKLGTQVGVGSVKIAFPKTVRLNKIYLADQQADTLVYVDEIGVNIDLFNLLRKKILIRNLEVGGMISHVSRKAPTNDFNFQFISDAFWSGDTLPEPEKKPTKPWVFEVRNIRFSNIHSSYFDEVTGINARIDLGELRLDVENFDPSNMVFMAEKIDVSNSTAFLEMWNVETGDQTGEIAESTLSDVEKTDPFPGIGLGLLCLENISARYLNKDSQQDFSVDIGVLEFSSKTLDLNKQKLELGELFMANSSIKIEMASQPGIFDTAIIEKPLTESLFPDWSITMDKIAIENTNFGFDDPAAPKMATGMDYSHLFFNNLNIETGKIDISKEGLLAEIEHISFEEKCGLNIEKLGGKVEFSDKIAGIEGLEIRTPKSTILGSARLEFASPDALQNDLGQTVVSIDLKKSELNTSDIFYFAPDMAADSLLGQFKNETIIAGATAAGKINDLKIENLDLWIFDFTKLKTHGSITGLPETAGLGFDLTIESLATNLSDFKPFIDSLIPENISLPETFLIKGTAAGKTDDFITEMSVKSAFGDILTNGFYKKNKAGERDTYNLVFEINDLMVDQILSDTMYRNLSATGEIAGTGAGSDSISAIAGLMILEAIYNNYHYKNIEAKATMNGNVYSVEIKSNDPNILLDATAIADLRNQEQKFSTEINLEKLNLAALHFIEDTLIVSSSFSANANYTSPQNMDARLTAARSKLTRDNFSVPVNLLDMNFSVINNCLEAGLKSDLLDVSLSGNAEPQKLQKIIQAMLNKYLGVADSTGVLPGTQMAFSVDVHLPEKIKKLVGEDFDLSEITKMDGFYNGDNNELSAEMQINDLVYSGLNLDTLFLKINGKSDSLSIELDCRKINYDTIKIENFSIHEAIKRGDIFSEIKIADTSQIPRYLFFNEIKFDDSAVNISFLPDGLILDGAKWTVEKDNFLKISNSEITAQKFVFKNHDENIGFDSEKENPGLVFENFGVQNIFNILEFKRHGHILRGRLEGEIAFPGAGNDKLFFASLKIDSLFLFDIFAGGFSFIAETDSSNLNLGLYLKNNENKIGLSGDILDWKTKPEFDLNVLIDFTNLSLMEKYLQGNVTEMSGKVDGDITVSGTPEMPDIIGTINFEETAMKISALNFMTHLRNEKLTFNATGLHFNNFVIEDATQQKLTINGNILTENYSDFNFDLSMVTRNFQPINSTIADNKTFYGKLNIDTDVKLKGTLNNPELDANIKINNHTDLTFALPGSELSLITPEGIVHFVDHADVNDTLVVATTGNYLADSIISGMSGINLTTNLEIDPDAKFTLVIDPKSGDYLSLGGQAILSIAHDPGGNQTITGIFEVKTGIYQLSFYGLVKKSFTIKPGSNISWSGKPMDASLNITAEYEVTTSSVALIANETNAMSDAEKNIYKQRLPYTVLLNIDGFLAQPEISFNITLPDKYMINYPQVASKLGQLNTPEMESERNKQVFGLLVTGSFLADNPFASTGTSTSSIATTAAINSVNGILADQLNNVSSRFVKGVDLNFGINTFEDYSGSSGEMRTELDVKISKKLLNDRLTVEAQGSFDVEGSKNNYSGQSSQEMWGEFAVIYSLDADGQYKLRAYRENAYDFFDGEVAYSGIAFIFEKEFNSLKGKSKKEHKESKKARQQNKEGLKSDEPTPGNK